jgi:monovalent cation/hydrogen antiporter
LVSIPSFRYNERIPYGKFEGMMAMGIFLAVLVMLALIGASNVINRFIPIVPVPLIQIALGVAVAVIPSGVHLELEPELFFVLFIAPLLYNDGKHTPRGDLWRLRAPILIMAVGLVFVTVFAVGYAIHWMIPSIPLPAAFGLAAILSPTDAVAVGALAGRIHLPKSLMRLLEGEALMNDASGLVAFKFAIAAAVTGVFSLPKASFSFLVISIGGLLIGAVLAFVIVGLRKLLRRAGMEDVTVHMLLQILTPFLLYLTAEELGMSGILAAVAGGIVHAVEHDRSESSHLQLNTVSVNTWSVILFILNGLVFVILGLQIPDVSRTILDDPLFNNFQIIGYAAAIFAMLIVLRFLWSFAFTRLPGRKGTKGAPSIKILAMTAISGVRGAVTLAGAFSIPLVLDSGAPFPQRDLILFLAALVILFSLVTASILLPLLARKDSAAGAADKEKEEQEFQIKVMMAAVLALHHETNEHNEAAVASVIADYRLWISQARTKGKPRRSKLLRRGEDTELRLLAVKAERQFAQDMLDKGSITKEQARLFFIMLDQLELILSNRSHMWGVMVKLLLHRLQAGFKPGEGKTFTKLRAADQEALKRLKRQSSEAAIALVKQQDESDQRAAVLEHYRHVLERLNRMSAASRRHDGGFTEQKKELHWVAIQAERNEVQTLFERGEISRVLAGELRRMIRDREAAMFEQVEIG